MGKVLPLDIMESMHPQLSQNPKTLWEKESQRPSPSRYGLHRKMYHLPDSDINVCFPISLTPLTRCSVTENKINTLGGFVIKEIQAHFDYCWQRAECMVQTPVLFSKLIFLQKAQPCLRVSWTVRQGCNFSNLEGQNDFQARYLKV